jgi:glycosyltransferase involved in cell wall biosynthesis
MWQFMRDLRDDAWVLSTSCLQYGGDHRVEKIFVNSRVLLLRSNGQKRVAEELIHRIPALSLVRPAYAFRSGVEGHAWEQGVLPFLTRGKPLWSPSTSGPLVHPNHIVTVHDIAFVDVPEYFGQRFAWWYREMVGGLIKKARHVVTVSEFTRRRLIEHYGLRDKHVSTVHLGAADHFVQRSAANVDAARVRYGLVNHRYFIGFRGTDPRKNTQRLLIAWKMAGLWRKGLKLVLFGRGENPAVYAASGCESLRVADETPGVLAVGEINDEILATLYSGAEGLLFPSLYEGFGLPVVEAARCGCRVLTSNRSSLPEVSPRDAILIDPENVRAIAEGIIAIAMREDEPDRKQERIREMDKFDWGNAAYQYREIFAREFA